MKPRHLATAAAAIALLAGGYTFLAGAADPLLPAAHAQDAADRPDADAETPAVEAITMGDPDAPVTMIEYASFTCSHCADFHRNVLPELKADYIDTGRVAYEYREVFFDRPGLWASMVARCTSSDTRFFGVADLLYNQQETWSRGEPGQVVAELRRIGGVAGLGSDELDACLSDAGLAEALVANYEENARADGIRSTPSFVIDGETYGNMSYDAMSELLDERLSNADG